MVGGTWCSYLTARTRTHIYIHIHTHTHIHIHIYTYKGSQTRGRENGIRFDLNSANRSIDFTAFKHPLAKRQPLGVVPRPRVREGPARSGPEEVGVRVHERGEKDDQLRSAPLLVADAVLIIMLIEISTAAKIDSPSGFHARIANASQCDLVFSIVHTSCGGGRDEREKRNF